VLNTLLIVKHAGKRFLPGIEKIFVSLIGLTIILKKRLKVGNLDENTMINYWLHKHMLNKTCKELKESLSSWYNVNKHKGMTGGELYEAKRTFFRNNPQYQKYEFNIHCGYDVDGTTWQPSCLNGCCECKAVVRGVYALPIDWEYTRNLAFKVKK